MESSLLAHPFGLSQIPSDPSFRDSAVNTIAVVPLLSSNKDGEDSSTKSAHSFRDLLDALSRHSGHSQSSTDSDLLLVVPNSSLTRPGDWRYNDTPLKTFHWQHGCQRLRIFDGRPEHSQPAHDRLMNHTVTRDWIDLCPSRRTAAVIGVLNIHDCKDLADLHRAEEELHKWAENYATPPYEVTAHGKNAQRDQPVQRLFVYDSFDEECQKIDLSQSKMGSSILAFPPTDEAHAQMMDLHLNVVVNDLAVAIFRDLETKIRESDAISSSNTVQAPASRRPFTRIISGASSTGSAEELPVSHSVLTVSSLAGLVSKDNILAKEESSDAVDTSDTSEAGNAADASGMTSKDSSIHDKPPPKPPSPSTPLLMTPLDDYWESSELGGRDVDSIRKRDTGRREKFAADLSLLAGSPLDAYERYLKAAELCKSGTLDPLWYAASLEGCAAAHIAMAEAGGYSVDDYLENNFQFPDEFMAVLKRKVKEDKGTKPATKITKQTLPQVVHALCEEALNIIDRHPKLAAYHAELLLKLAWYYSDSSERHLRCRWGEDDGGYSGEPGDIPRWEKASVFKLEIDQSKLDEENPVPAQTFSRVQKVCELLQQATSLTALDGGTRVDVAAQAVRICLQGIQPTAWANGSTTLITLPRKAAFFATIAAETVSDSSSGDAGNLWLLATRLYSREPADSYGWGVLRAACLSALSWKGKNELALEASEQLLALLGELTPSTRDDQASPDDEKTEEDSHVKLREGKDETRSSSKHGVKDSSSEKLEEEDTQKALKSKANLFAKQLREGFNTLTSSSTFLAQQAKWAYDEPISPLETPLGDSSPLASTVTSLKCVWANSSLRRCAEAHRQCMKRITTLRRSAMTPSSGAHEYPSIYRSEIKPALPLYVASTEVVKTEVRYDLETVTVTKKNAEDGGGAMATFFNPYESKRQAGGTKCVNNVTEEEERAVSVVLGNRLSVPLQILSCQLIFSGRGSERAISNSLTFDVPPNVNNFSVQFPYIVSAKTSSEEEKGEEFDVKGIGFTCLGRSEFLPFSLGVTNASERQSSASIPPSGSEYAPLKSNGNEETVDSDIVHRIHAYPCQPKLEVMFTKSQIPLETLRIDLVDGALFSSPAISLKCYSGPSALGNVHELEILVDGVPGLSKKLFSMKETPSTHCSDEQFLTEMVEGSASCPIKARIIADELTFDGINGITDGERERQLKIQIAASYTMSKALAKDTRLRFRIRYRGNPTSSVEVWRNQEFTFNVRTLAGPQITSITFKPDLDRKCFFRKLTEELYIKASGERKVADHSSTSNKPQDEPSADLIHGIGKHQSVNVCDDDVGLLVTVSNPTSSIIELSKSTGPVGGVEGTPIDQITVNPSVNTTIPMILKRVSRQGKEKDIGGIARELVDATKMTWKNLGCTKDIARGQVRIDPDHMMDLVRQFPSIASKVCETPCSIGLQLDDSAASATPMILSPGSPGVKICVTIEIAEWVTDEERKACSAVTELFCVRETDGLPRGEQFASRDYIWAGKLRHKEAFANRAHHRAHLVFCTPGQYIVSACARISRKEHVKAGIEEVWWAPVAQRIVVEAGKSLAQ